MKMSRRVSTSQYFIPALHDLTTDAIHKVDRIQSNAPCQLRSLTLSLQVAIGSISKHQ